MGFHKHPGHANRHGGAGDHRNEFALAAGTGALAARLLDRMRGVNDHRIAGRRQHRQGAHVADQRVVTETGPALGQQNLVITGAGDLGGHMGHVPGRQKLPFFNIHRLAGGRRGQ